ncbi:glycosyltransferase family 2 protein [bacterium]|nr:glycosyltransferase family 2 protein [candidate division CSSED10-310 bacterium]
MTTKPDISIIIPFYNEEDNVINVYNALKTVLEKEQYAYEIIAVDDGSRDDTWNRLKSLAESDETLRAFRLRRNFGQTPALAAGFDKARGQKIITMDGDGQNDPEDIPLLIKKLDEGYDLVSGWRKDRKDPFVSRRLPSILANKLIKRVTRVPINDLGCSLKIYRKEIIDHIQLYGELHRFLPVLAKWVGARIGETPVRHHPRKFGQSKYGISRTIRVLLDLITVKFLMSYSTSPIQIFGATGIWFIIFGFLSGIATVLMRLITVNGEPIRTMTRNPLLIIAGVSIVIGIQFIIMGLLGEINIRTYYESQKKPIYIIGESSDKHEM